MKDFWNPKWKNCHIFLEMFQKSEILEKRQFLEDGVWTVCSLTRLCAKNESTVDAKAKAIVHEHTCMLFLPCLSSNVTMVLTVPSYSDNNLCDRITNNYIITNHR